LPKGGRRLQVSCSGWSAVLRVDTVRGSPDGKFTKRGGCRVAAGRCPYRLFAAMAGTVSDLIREAGNELGPLSQISTPHVMILKGLRHAGKPG